MSRNEDNVIMEGVTIRRPNFSGSLQKFNPKGDRNFLVLLDDRVAKAMARDGWNVKFFQARQDDDGEDLPEQPFLKVAVRFDKYPPQIYMITSRNRTKLGESEVDVLDTADIVNVDMIVTPSRYDRDGVSGIKAYLKSMYVTIEEDYLAQKYADLDELRDRGVRDDD